MTEKELCSMCNEYSYKHRCELKPTCKLMGILKQNKELRKKVRELKRENEELREENYYMVDPNCIGDRHEMGCW